MKTISAILVLTLILVFIPIVGADNLPGGLWTGYTPQSYSDLNTWSVVALNNQSIINWANDNFKSINYLPDIINDPSNLTYAQAQSASFNVNIGVFDGESWSSVNVLNFETWAGRQRINLPTGKFVAGDTSGLYASIGNDEFDGHGEFCDENGCFTSGDVGGVSASSLQQNVSEANTSMGSFLQQTLADLNTSIGEGNSTENIQNVGNVSYVLNNLWTSQNSYPTGCSLGNYVRVIGDTLTCTADADTDASYYFEVVTGSANKITGNGTAAYNAYSGVTCISGTQCYYTILGGYIQDIYAKCSISSYIQSGVVSLGYDLNGAVDYTINTTISAAGIADFRSSGIKKKINRRDIIANPWTKWSGTFQVDNCIVTMEISYI